VILGATIAASVIALGCLAALRSDHIDPAVLRGLINKCLPDTPMRMVKLFCAAETPHCTMGLFVMGVAMGAMDKFTNYRSMADAFSISAVRELSDAEAARLRGTLYVRLGLGIFSGLLTAGIGIAAHLLEGGWYGLGLAVAGAGTAVLVERQARMLYTDMLQVRELLLQRVQLVARSDDATQAGEFARSRWSQATGITWPT
jgi:hypothetical protein